MTVQRINWLTCNGAQLARVVLIAGFPRALVCDGVTVTSVTWTGDADPAWHVGTSPDTSPWLLMRSGRDTSTPALRWTENANPLTGFVDVGSLSLSLASVGVVNDLDPVGLALAGREVTPFTVLSAAVGSTDTTVNVQSTAAFPSSGVVHIGKERITYSGKTSTAFTGCVRATAGTVARAYRFSSAGAQHRVYGTAPGASDSLPGVLGRRVTVWLATLDGTSLVDPTLMYDGRAAEGFGTDARGAWTLPVVHAVKALAEKLSAPRVMLSGYAHGNGFRASVPAGASPGFLDLTAPITAAWSTGGGVDYVTLNSDAAEPDNGGWSATREVYAERWNRAARALGAPQRVTPRAASTSVHASDATAGRLTVWCGWVPSERSYPGDSGDTATATNVENAPMPEAHVHLAGRVHLSATDLAAIPPTPAYPLTDASAAWWTLACDRDNGRLPKARIVGALRSLDPSADPVHADGVDVASLTPGVEGDPAQLSTLLTRATVAVLGLHARGARWWSVLQHAVFPQLGTLAGVDRAEDSFAWERIADVAGRHGVFGAARSYTLDVEAETPVDLLRNEGALMGAALATYRGRVALATFGEAAPSEARSFTFTVEHLRRSTLPTLRTATQGIATGYALTWPNGNVVNVVDAAATAESKAGVIVRARAPEGVDLDPTDDATQAAVVTVAAAMLAPYARAYSVASLPGDLRQLAVELGDAITVSDWLLPDGAGARGLNGAAVRVTGRAVDLDAGTVDLTGRVSDRAVSGYAPEALVSGISGATLTLDTATLGVQGFADDGATDGGASTFTVGDKVRLVELDATSPAAPFASEVSAVSGSTITLASSPGASWETRAATGLVLLSFEDYSTATAAQRGWAFIADVATYQHADGSQGRRWV